MEVYLYKTNKKINSVSVPNPTGRVLHTGVKIRGPVSLMSPVVDFGYTPMPLNYPTYNYMYIEEWARYYYISNWVFSNGKWACSCTEDVLASYNTQIKALQLFVLRSASNYDTWIVDTKYQAKARAVTYAVTDKVSPFARLGSLLLGGVGCFCVTTMSGKPGAMGNQHYYMDDTAFYEFLKAIYTDTNWANISASEMSEEMQEILISPSRYIVSIVWLPFKLSAISVAIEDQTSTIYMGYWPFNIPYGTVYKINGNDVGYINQTMAMDIPKHPQSSRGQYMNSGTFSNYTLLFYPFGFISIDPANLIGHDELFVNYTVDCVTGAGTLRLSTDQSNNVFYYGTAQVGVQVPVTSITIDPSKWQGALMTGAANALGQISGSIENAISGGYGTTQAPNWSPAANAVTNWISKNLFGSEINVIAARQAGGTGVLGDSGYTPELGAAAAANTSEPFDFDVGSILSATAAGMAQVSTSGQQGVRSFYNSLPVLLIGRFFTATDENLARWGRPLMKNVLLGSLSGYCLCAEADFGIAGALDVEIKAIASFLTSGVYIE